MQTLRLHIIVERDDTLGVKRDAGFLERGAVAVKPGAQRGLLIISDIGDLAMAVQVLSISISHEIIGYRAILCRFAEQ
jgi:hypothetical protein